MKTVSRIRYPGCWLGLISSLVVAGYFHSAVLGIVGYPIYCLGWSLALTLVWKDLDDG